jgi:predicted alpha/beta-fold hydrolase
VYTWHFLRTLREKAFAKLERFPDLFDPATLHRARTLFDFDDAVTAPVHGFESAHDYYSRSSSLQFLSAIQVPTLLLSSSDDPFLPPKVFDDVAMVARKNPSLMAELWSKGGHVGFVSGSPMNTHYYHEECIIEFLGLQVDRLSAVHTP